MLILSVFVKEFKEKHKNDFFLKIENLCARSIKTNMKSTDRYIYYSLEIYENDRSNIYKMNEIQREISPQCLRYVSSLILIDKRSSTPKRSFKMHSTRFQLAKWTILDEKNLLD